jgi:hypothetical protein
MARTPVLRDSKRINVSIEDALHKAAKDHAKRLHIKGGFSELIARLCVAELSRNGSLALKNSRHLPAKRTVK